MATDGTTAVRAPPQHIDDQCVVYHCCFIFIIIDYFVTEEVAKHTNHTNQTVGALLNATFGNAPELLTSSVALSVGYYRVVQSTLLGSMHTNLLFVFGNVLVGMLMISVAGLDDDYDNNHDDIVALEDS
eukprot:scaffold19122_cov23-Cyclotella_meneghiniana.AAC.2